MLPLASLRRRSLCHAVSAAFALGLVIANNTSSAGPAVVSVSSLNGKNGFQMDGTVGTDFDAGLSVSVIGDINSDGLDDVIVGAPDIADSGTGAGRSYVVFGRNDGFIPLFSLSTLNGSDGFQIVGMNKYDRTGITVSGTSDINGDGIDDLLIGSWGTGTPAIPITYVVFGHNAVTPFPAVLNLSTLNTNGNNGVYIHGVGHRVSSIGDVNGDTIDDIAVGTFNASYVIFGKSSGLPADIDVSTLTTDDGFKIEGSANPLDIKAAGDVDGDGLKDMVIGWPSASFNGNASGSAYVVFGRNTGFPSPLTLSTLRFTEGFRMDGAFIAPNTGAGEYAGSAVSGAGDINGDGKDDILIGAPANFSANPGGAYVVFGRSTFSSPLLLENLTGADGLRINGGTIDKELGGAVSAAGDMNGDGIDDLIIGASLASPDSQAFAGATYVVFGHKGVFPSTLNLANLDGNNGFRLDGEVQFDRFGFSVSGGGDINGDGLSDMIAGAHGAFPDGQNPGGSAYVIFGNDGIFKASFESP